MPSFASHSSPDQLTLGVGLDDDAQFKNFFVSDANQSLVSVLAASEEEPFFISGAMVHPDSVIYYRRLVTKLPPRVAQRSMCR